MLSKVALIVDDERTFDLPNRDVHHVRTAEDAIVFLEHQKVHELWLDHDLGMPDNTVWETVYPVVHYLEECAFFGQTVPIDCVYVHTSNPVGRNMIQRALEKYYTICHVDGDVVQKYGYIDTE